METINIFTRDAKHLCSNLAVLPVEAATAPTSTGGIPTMTMKMAAMKQMSRASLEEETDSVLWWKDWKPILPRACRDRKDREKGKEITVVVGVAVNEDPQ